MTYEYWPIAAADRLAALAPTHTLAQLAAIFGRSEMAVMHKLGRMGISLTGAKTTTRKPRTRQQPGACHEECPGGNRCCLSSDVEHELHVCREPNCVCHGFTRYHEGRKR